jgi:hypothetical protein
LQWRPVAPQLRAAVQTATAADPAELAAVEAQINEGMRQLAVASVNVAVPSDMTLGLAGRLGTGSPSSPSKPGWHGRHLQTSARRGSMRLLPNSRCWPIAPPVRSWMLPTKRSIELSR